MTGATIKLARTNAANEKLPAPGIFLFIRKFTKTCASKSIYDLLTGELLTLVWTDSPCWVGKEL